MSIKIRMAVKEDASVIEDFIVQLAHYQKESTDSLKLTAEALQGQLEEKHPPFECLIAELDDRAVGFALFHSNYSTWEGKPGIYLEDLFVLPAVRLHGIGRKLLLELCRICLSRGSTRLDWSVQSNNFKALRFYSVLGAKPMPEWIRWRLEKKCMEELLDLDEGVSRLPVTQPPDLIKPGKDSSMTLLSQEDASSLASIH